MTHEKSIPWNVIWRVLTKERVRGNDTPDITKADLPSAADCSTVVAAEVHVEPAHYTRSDSIYSLIKNNSPMSGMAVYVPAAMRNSPPYLMLKLSGLSMTANPESEVEMAIIMNTKRCWNRSEKYAMNMANANAAAHGGTEWTADVLDLALEGDTLCRLTLCLHGTILESREDERCEECVAWSCQSRYHDP